MMGFERLFLTRNHPTRLHGNELTPYPLLLQGVPVLELTRDDDIVGDERDGTISSVTVATASARYG